MLQNRFFDFTGFTRDKVSPCDACYAMNFFNKSGHTCLVPMSLNFSLLPEIKFRSTSLSTSASKNASCFSLLTQSSDYAVIRDGYARPQQCLPFMAMTFRNRLTWSFESTQSALRSFRWAQLNHTMFLVIKPRSTQALQLRIQNIHSAVRLSRHQVEKWSTCIELVSPRPTRYTFAEDHITSSQWGSCTVIGGNVRSSSATRSQQPNTYWTHQCTRSWWISFGDQDIPL